MAPDKARAFCNSAPMRRLVVQGLRSHGVDLALEVLLGVGGGRAVIKAGGVLVARIPEPPNLLSIGASGREPEGLHHPVLAHKFANQPLGLVHCFGGILC